MSGYSYRLIALSTVGETHILDYLMVLNVFLFGAAGVTFSFFLFFLEPL